MTRMAAAGPRSSNPTGGCGISAGALPWLGVYCAHTTSHSRGAEGAWSPAWGALSSLLLKVTCELILLCSLSVLEIPMPEKVLTAVNDELLTPERTARVA